MDTSDTAPIVKTAYTVLDRGIRTLAQEGTGPLGCAFAIPRGSEPIAVEEFSPWVRVAVCADFHVRTLRGVDLTALEPTLSWKVSHCRRYIRDVRLDTAAPRHVRTHACTVTVHYAQPAANTRGVGCRIAFTGSIDLDRVPGGPSVGFRGEVRSCGVGIFDIGTA